MKKTLSLLLSLIFALAFLISLPVSAANSKTYIYNEYAECINAPSGYKCERIIRGSQLGIGDFSTVSDLYTDEYIYVADSGNNRIVILNKDYTLHSMVSTVILNGELQSLSKPSGVFFADGLLYICDTGNARAVAIDEKENVKRIFQRPETELFSDDFEFKPSKISVNSAGTVFIVASGVYQGLLQYGNNDAFIGFFGANKVEVTASVLIQNIWKNIFSDKQRQALIRTLPTEYTNLYIDGEDMIYTATATSDSKQIKKLNSWGNNILVYPGSNSALLQKGYNRNNFGDQKYDYIRGALQKSIVCDVNIDDEGVIAVLDNRRGRVFLYDNEQNLLCIFGGTGTQKGFFKNASSLEKNGSSYLVADTQINTITVFSENVYMSTIRSALEKYNNGNFDAAADCWEQVLTENSALSVAYKGVGRAKLLKGEYREAMELFKIGDDRYYYSMAVRQYRREFIRENFVWLMPLTLLACIISVVIIKAVKKAIIRSGERVKRNEKS